MAALQLARTDPEKLTIAISRRKNHVRAINAAVNYVREKNIERSKLPPRAARSARPV